MPSEESSPLKSFIELGVPTPVATVLAKSGKTAPFPIQSDTLPDSLAGRDILGKGQTGSGKTLAFAIPMVTRLSQSSSTPTASHPRGLVLAPTRELATQIAAEIAPVANVFGLRVATIFGGVSQRPQEKALRGGADIVVACPGRLEDLMEQRIVHVDHVEIAVIDEADHMSDLGFLPAVTRILEQTPAGGQRLLFSATLDRDVDKLVRRFLHEPARHAVDTTGVPTDMMSHHVLVIKDPEEKTKLVVELASGRGRRILFTRTKHQAERLTLRLNQAGIPAVELHGNLSQRARDRNLATFSRNPEDGGVRVLVATDVAARGVHVNDVRMVIHVDPPAEHKAYLHRSGRTARAGASGTVVTVAFVNQRREVARILKHASVTAAPTFVNAGAPEVARLVGKPAELAPSRDNAPVVTAAPSTGRSRKSTRTDRPGKGRRRPSRSLRETQVSADRGRSQSPDGGAGHKRPTRRREDERSTSRPHSSARPRVRDDEDRADHRGRPRADRRNDQPNDRRSEQRTDRRADQRGDRRGSRRSDERPQGWEDSRGQQKRRSSGKRHQGGTQTDSEPRSRREGRNDRRRSGSSSRNETFTGGSATGGSVRGKRGERSSTSVRSGPTSDHKTSDHKTGHHKTGHHKASGHKTSEHKGRAASKKPRHSQRRRAAA